MDLITEQTILLDIRKWNEWMKERFPNKDYISLSDLLSDYESILFEKDQLKEDVE